MSRRFTDPPKAENVNRRPKAVCELILAATKILNPAAARIKSPELTGYKILVAKDCSFCYHFYMSKIKVGVIGVGHLGSIHAKIYKEIPNCTLIGVCDIDKNRLETISKSLQVTGWQDHRELLGKVDAVSVAVPTKFHQKIAFEFLNNNRIPAF